MSLQYVIDGYNLINHPVFKEQANKKIKDRRFALLELIRTKRLCGSSKNKITVVFDGYPGLGDSQGLSEGGPKIGVIFSRKETADERIKKMVENSGNPRNTVVVSDDKEVKFFAGSLGAGTISVGEFIGQEESGREKEALKAELTYAQMHLINKELRKLWLK